MNKHKNYYGILGINRASNAKEIKLAYYAMSKENHPDKGGDEDKFKEITEAYKILSNNTSKDEYDKKSKYGANYDELLEIYDYEFNNDAKNYDKDKYEEWKTAEQLNIIVYIDDTFNGSVEYERWVVCKSCNGSGKDLDSKIAIRDEKGNIVRYFDASDGCDFCDGTGKWGELDCLYCRGNGKVNAATCKTCNGDKRVLGKQKLSKIKVDKDAKDHKVEYMGNSSKEIPGKVGHLWLVRKKAAE
jgi:DnaJ family protein A protein 2